MSKILTTKNNKILIDTNKKIYTIEKIGATIKSGGGTPVPNSGYVGNVYLNTNLSVEEVVSLLEKLNYNADLMSSSGIDTYGLIGNPNVNVLMVATLNGNYAIMANSNVLFSSAIVEGMTTFVGWNENFNGVFEYNGEALPTINNAMGEENDKLTSLFSTTPFGQAEEITLNGEYDGSTIEVTDLSGGWQGTTVPKNEYIENVYFNTNLSTEEVINLLGQLEYDESHIYVPIASADRSNAIMIMYDGGDCFIQNLVTQEYYFISSLSIAGHLGADFEGWNSLYKDYILPLNSTLVEEIEGMVIGTQNDKLSSLFSTTPFTKTEENTINIKNYINEKKIPLSIKVNVEGAGGVNFEKLEFERNYTITVNDTEIQTYSYQLTEEQKTILLDRVDNKPLVNDIASFVNIVMDYGYEVYCVSCLYPIHETRYVDGAGISGFSLKTLDAVIGFDIDDNNVIYLSIFGTRDSNMLDQVIETCTRVYIAIAKE